MSQTESDENKLDWRWKSDEVNGSGAGGSAVCMLYTYHRRIMSLAPSRVVAQLGQRHGRYRGRLQRPEERTVSGRARSGRDAHRRKRRRRWLLLPQASSRAKEAREDMRMHKHVSTLPAGHTPASLLWTRAQKTAARNANALRTFFYCGKAGCDYSQSEV